jgi:tetratricopeptide (TPR) repeat protein
MPLVKGKDPFDERVNIILDELSQGIRWDRPCLILAVYRSEQIKNEIQTLLVKSLRLTTAQLILSYTVDKAYYDVPLDLLNHPKHEQAVFFISGLRWGGGRGYSNAYRALNMHREYLVDGKIKAIFWVTEREARQLSRFSPDFWAFRSSVVEFPDLPVSGNKKPFQLSNLHYDNLYTTDAPDFHAWVRAAGKFFAQGCMDEAILTFRKALRKYPGEQAIYLQISEIYISLLRFPAANRILLQAGKGKTDRIDLLKALERLKQVSASLHRSVGGFREQQV